MKEKLLHWLANGETGISSKTMAFAAMGVEITGYTMPPSDPSDFNRCLKLVEAVPEIREAFPAIAALSPVWKALLDRWDEVRDCFVEEVGIDWCKGYRKSAVKTWKLLREIGC